MKFYYLQILSCDGGSSQQRGRQTGLYDVDAASFHLDVNSGRKDDYLSHAAVIPVHLYGRAMDLREVAEFAAAYRLQIIEDAAQAHGSAYNGAKVGAAGRSPASVSILAKTWEVRRCRRCDHERFRRSAQIAAASRSWKSGEV